MVSEFREALALPNGIVLVTGPTGSGKTTTLYIGLLELNSITRKIITVEDPIEYRLHGSIEHAAVANGMVALFQSGLDAIMAGETTIEEVTRTVHAAA